ncbi:Hypothetical protein CINCED_3A015503 [Cinara cedri]|uniref:Uncharacterized protein n=1 Tax=Cinara cedri TaxID=506608 RepID=A0A5E4M597_9HEMI|nr:Hypothetical protein CINCED_3A015503 [Cinara cedri]
MHQKVNCPCEYHKNQRELNNIFGRNRIYRNLSADEVNGVCNIIGKYYQDQVTLYHIKNYEAYLQRKEEKLRILEEQVKEIKEEEKNSKEFTKYLYDYYNRTGRD